MACCKINNTEREGREGKKVERMAKKENSNKERQEKRSGCPANGLRAASKRCFPSSVLGIAPN
jgi:hypothetical protein